MLRLAAYERPARGRFCITWLSIHLGVSRRAIRLVAQKLGIGPDDIVEHMGIGPAPGRYYRDGASHALAFYFSLRADYRINPVVAREMAHILLYGRGFTATCCLVKGSYRDRVWRYQKELPERGWPCVMLQVAAKWAGDRLFGNDYDEGESDEDDEES